jgi:peptidoglycan/LPS O-acetylase OafA/YrhL
LYLANFLPYISPLAAVPQSSLHLASFGVLQTLRPVDMTLSLGHFWSLCVEEQFYLFWPWVVFSVRSRRTLLVICLSTVVSVPFMRLAAQHYAPSWMLMQDLLFRATPFQLDALVWGGLIAVMWRVERWRERLLTAGRVLAISCLIIAVGYLALNIHPRSGGDWRHTYAYPIWSRSWGLVFVDVFSVGAILSCLRPSRLLIKTLGAAPIRWVGRISYGAYVFHDIFHEPVSRISWHISGHYLHYLEPYDEYVTALLGLGVTFVLAWMSYRYFETPFLKLKDKFKTEPV